MKKVIFLWLVLLGFTKLSQAQRSPTDRYKRPNFTTYLDAGFGTTGFDLGISARTRNHLATSIFLKAFWDHRTFTDFRADVMAAVKAKFYPGPLTKGYFVGPFAGGHHFAPGFRPIFGLATGYDFYTHFNILGSNTTRFGVELQAGLDTIGNGYIGVNINIGFGFLNTGEIKHH